MLNAIHVFEYMKLRLEKLNEHGIEIEISNDLDKLIDVSEGIDEHNLSPLYNTDYFDMYSERFLWVHGTDHEGKTIHIQASKLEDLGANSLDCLLSQQLRRGWGNKGDKKISCCPISAKIKGRVAYHGDMWLSSKCRGDGLGRVLGTLGLAIIYSTWQPDFVFGFLESPLQKKGVIFNHGYWNFEPLDQEWKLAFPWLYQEDFLIWMTRENLDYSFRSDFAKTRTKQRLPGNL
ncbi:hypothetical protein [Curvivirga aplysinae]|uniref:hypothetical protein n=1 Tax=Curvivirga aplysinae TaxID=2529852 RepID=UPI0012BBED21|nr:hypothetical protein [Curvivirga aplysinae]MTI10521.1 hypothetical protein [Curvivirga aplysinae]